MYFYNESLIISLHSLHKYNKLYLKLIKYSSESSEQAIETIATTHRNNPFGGIEIIRMNHWNGLNTPWRLFEWSKGDIKQKTSNKFGASLIFLYLCMAIINSENTDSCFKRTIYDIVPIPINRDLYSHIELYRSIIIYRDRRMG